MTAILQSKHEIKIPFTTKSSTHFINGLYLELIEYLLWKRRMGKYPQFFRTTNNMFIVLGFLGQSKLRAVWPFCLHALQIAIGQLKFKCPVLSQKLHVFFGQLEKMWSAFQHHYNTTVENRMGRTMFFRFFSQSRFRRMGGLCSVCDATERFHLASIAHSFNKAISLPESSFQQGTQ